MALFRYEAEDKTGKVLRGVMDAGSEQEVARNLTGMGYNPRVILDPSGRQASTRSVGTAGVMRTGIIQQPSSATVVPVSVQSEVPPAALAIFFRQLATLVKSGRPIIQSSTDITTRNSKLQRVLGFMQEHLQSGKQLSGAMAAFPNIFPVHSTASVWAGELAGKLDIALDEIASDFELEASEKRYAMIGRWIGKISALSLIFAIPASNLSTLLMPGFKAAMDHPDYGPKQVLLNIITTYVRTTLWKSVIYSAILIIAWIIWGYVKRIPKVKRATDGMLLRVPIWGKLHRYRALCRFMHVLDGLYSAGISPGTAWEAASLTPRNSEIAERLRLARDIVPPDAGIAQFFATSGVFDADDVGMANAGEKSGSIPDVLAKMSSTYADKAASQRTIARAWSVGLLIWFSIILTGYICVRMLMGYINLAFDAAGMVGS